MQLEGRSGNSHLGWSVSRGAGAFLARVTSTAQTARAIETAGGTERTVKGKGDRTHVDHHFILRTIFDGQWLTTRTSDLIPIVYCHFLQFLLISFCLRLILNCFLAPSRPPITLSLSLTSFQCTLCSPLCSRSESSRPSHSVRAHSHPLPCFSSRQWPPP